MVQLNDRFRRFDDTATKSGEMIKMPDTISGKEGTTVYQNVYNITTNYNVSTGETAQEHTEKTEYRQIESSVFIEEYKRSIELIQLLTKIGVNDLWKDIPAIEQIRASFLSIFRELRNLKSRREKYYFDLFQMIDIGVTYLDIEAISQDTIATFIEALTCMCKKINSDDLKKIRKRFRNSNISFIPMLKKDTDLKKEIEDFFNEATA